MLIYRHESCRQHDTGAGHPEHAGRLAAVEEALRLAFPAFPRIDAPPGRLEQIRLAHPQRHVEAVLAAVPTQGYAAVDADTVLSPRSGDAALHAVGALCGAVHAVFGTGPHRQAFAAVRPPGHHAEANRAMGFCLFNAVAVGAAWALHEGLAERVAVLDFDVHHGNGTQDIFWQEGRVRFASSHQYPLYPGTGARAERGALGNILNAPLPPGAGGAVFREAWERLLGELDRFEPDLIMISAGFDAHRLDPLADLMLETDDYVWIGERIGALAAAHAAGRAVATLEGGYSLTALREAVPAFLSALAAAAGPAPTPALPPAAPRASDP